MRPASVLPTQETQHPLTQPQSLSTLSKISAIALFGNGLSYILGFLVAIITIGLSLVALLPVLFFALLTWITAFMIVRRVRGALTAGTVISLITLTLYLVVPATRSGILHPAASPLHFSLLIITLAFALVAIVTTIGAKQ
jgi:hypothetical protein